MDSTQNAWSVTMWYTRRNVNSCNIRTLGTKIPRRLFKAAVCKYPTTVNESELYILFSKPYSLIWHLVRGNRVRNGGLSRPFSHDFRPKHAESVHQKLHFWKFLWTVCSTTQSTLELIMAWMMSTAFRCSKNRLSSRSPLCWLDEYVHVHTTIVQTQVDFVDFHKRVETNSWILMSHISFDMISFSFQLTCPV